MTLRCKPGDMALVIKPKTAMCPACGAQATAVRAGAVVRVLRLLVATEWELEEPINVRAEFSCGSRLYGAVISLEDEILQPLPADPDAESTDTPVGEKVEA